MKKLNKLITIQFFRSFIPIFFVVLFIMLMQFIWLYIDDLAGKGLGMFTIVQLMFFFSASIIPLALPLSILLSSIMSFGNMGETYELIAAKAAGISIWKIFRPMFYIMICLSIFAFFVSNVLIPKATLKYKALLYDIKQQKPALLIKEGVFYNGIEGISMRIGRKDPVNHDLMDIVIYDNRSNTGRPVIVVAQRGRMHMSANNRYMFFTLYNGARYEEMDKQAGYDRTMPHTTLSFSEEQITFDMYAFNLNRTDEGMFKDNYQMLNIFQLKNNIDSLQRYSNDKRKGVVSYYDMFIRVNDSLYGKVKPDTVITIKKSVLDLYNGDKLAVLQSSLNNARTIKSVQDYVMNEIDSNEKLLIRHKIEWHRKFTLSVACLIMFFIGAPFGTIIRKGGFGTPVVVSVLLYILFHVISITGEKMAKNASVTPLVGIWLPIFILAPIGFFLTFQAANDSGIFDKSAWVRIFKKLFLKRAKVA